MPAEPRPRVGIVGAGLAGVATAWMLDPRCDCVLIDKNPRLGGHNHTVEVDVRGVAVPVDLGAQFFGPLLQPTFTRFLTSLGLYDPAAPSAGASITRSMGTTLMSGLDTTPAFVSPMFWDRAWPLWAPWNLAGQGAFLALAVAARRFERDGDWALTLDEWLAHAPGLTRFGREQVLLPWLAALAGCDMATLRGFSARAALSVPGRAIPPSYVAPFTWSNLRAGLQSVPERLADDCAHLDRRLGHAAVRVARRPGGWTVHRDGAPSVDVDRLVLAAPPHTLTPLLAEADPALAGLLRDFESFRTRMLLHRDPAYVHRDRRHWSAYNALVTDGWCEGSVWLGAIREPHPDGGTVDVYKSWATARPWEPTDVVAEAEYRHAALTPAHVRAQARVRERQGWDDLWFAGSWTRDVDLQETALLSALEVARGMGVPPRWPEATGAS